MLANCHIKDNTMYHRRHHQEKNVHPSSRMSIPSERCMFLQGVTATGDSGLVLSSDAKPRLKWTLDLHERFTEAVNQLGGAESKHESNCWISYCIVLCLANILFLQKLHQSQSWNLWASRDWPYITWRVTFRYISTEIDLSILLHLG